LMSEIEIDIYEGKGTTDMAEKLVALYKEEGLDAPVAKAYEIAAKEYMKIGKIRMARKYAELAVEMGKLWLGPGSLDWKRMKGLLEELKVAESNEVETPRRMTMGF
jgi:hypothetical protein